jgi:hypothetical protein
VILVLEVPVHTGIKKNRTFKEVNYGGTNLSTGSIRRTEKNKMSQKHVSETRRIQSSEHKPTVKVEKQKKNFVKGP